MGPGAFETDVGVLGGKGVNENPIGLDVAVPASGEFAVERMVSQHRWQGPGLNQQIEHGTKFGGVLAALFGAFDVFFELAGAAEGPHRPRSA